MILEDEVATGFLSEMEKNLILELLQKSMLRISYRNKQLCQEVYDMTEPVLKCRTDAYFESVKKCNILTAQIADRDATIAGQDATIADQGATIANQGATIADQNAIIAEYKRLYGDLPKQTN